MEIETLLTEEIVDEFSRLSKMEVGTDAYKTTVDGLTKLMDRAIEINKFNEDCKAKEAARQLDNEMKEKQLKEQIKSREIDTELKQKQFEAETKDQRIKNLITIGSYVLPAVLTVWGTYTTLKFEETGTITTAMGRGFINKLLPKK